MSGEFIVEEKIARCKPRTDGGYLNCSAMRVKTAFSRMRKRRGRISCIRLETFRVFYRVSVPPTPRRASGLTRSGKSREKIWTLGAARRQAFRRATVARADISILKHFAHRASGRGGRVSLERLMRLDFVRDGLLFA
ncbi:MULTISPECIES: hypothetical protein [unclassified Burkholderia]|uniref:hypothetical protein n=1 Tax=unclassified Burkholderia TaxID=2613784 RepID=UPI001423AE7F|nr:MULTISPECIES: hypothetical protein [unclassified Burkholderia]